MKCLAVCTTFVVALLLAPAGVDVAHADLAAIYLEGNGGFVAGETGELAPGGEEPDHGAAIGYRLGARVLFIESYIDRQNFSNGSVTRRALGGYGSAGIGGLRLYGRAGIGIINESEGALAGDIMPASARSTADLDRNGVLAYIGGGLEKEVAYALSLGVGLQSEYFRLKPRDESMFGDEATNGADVFAFAYLKFELGL
jgi:hypothetical protein